MSITFNHPGVTFNDWRYDFNGNLLDSVSCCLQSGNACRIQAEKSAIRVVNGALAIRIFGDKTNARMTDDNLSVRVQS